MFGQFRNPLSSLIRPSTAFASSSRHTLLNPPFASGSWQTQFGVRHRSVLAPKRTKYRKAQKGRVSIPTGGSIKGTSLEHATYGLRLLSSARLTAAQLTSAQVAIKRKIKPVKGAECFLRVFPDIPVCVKGNETRMGKGKGSFEYWACRVPVGRVVFEVGGGGIREEIAKQAQVKLPVPSEFITSSAPPRLGSLTGASLSPPPAASPAPALLTEMDVKGEGKAVGMVLDREEERIGKLAEGLEGLQISQGGSGGSQARSMT